MKPPSEDEATEQLQFGVSLGQTGAPCLLGLTGSLAGQLFPLSSGGVVLGRSDQADIRLVDRGISRRHALIELDPKGTAMLRDLASTNGTYVGGRPVSSAVLREGDRVGLGPYATLLFVHRNTLEELEGRLKATVPLQPELVGRLAAGVAHELNTPLGAIRLAVEAAEIQMESRPEAAAKKLQNALQAAERAGAIVQKLLYYAGHTPTAQQPVELDLLIPDVLERMDRRVTFEPGGVPAVEGHLMELRQVVEALVQNALDATPNGEVRVATRLEGDLVVLVVEDRGQGVSEEDLQRIFEPFFTTRRFERQGLGLSVSQQIVARHGGTLEVERRASGGIRSVVRLRR